jgi:hypothetical protein
MVVVPPGGSGSLLWNAAADTQFRVPSGYFIAPRSATDNQAVWDVPKRPTQQLMDDISDGKPVPPVGAQQRADAIADIRYWQADAVVLGTRQDKVSQLRQAVEALFGPPQLVEGAYVWDTHRYR